MNALRTLAIDFGRKRTGIAFSDGNSSLALPLAQLSMEEKGNSHWTLKIKKIIDDYEIQQLLVGLPLEMSGNEGSAVQRVRSYVAMLKKQVQLPVIEWDERLTSEAADSVLKESGISKKKKKKAMDSVAAMILLQSYLVQHESSYLEF